MASCAGYVRDAFVMASLDKYSEYEYLEKILSDAICEEPIEYSVESLDAPASDGAANDKYAKYQREKYEPQPHYKRDN